MKKRKILHWGMLAATACMCTPCAMQAADVTHVPWGQDVTGASVVLYKITAGKSEVDVSNYGARIVSVRVPNRSGEYSNVIVGHDKVQDYMSPFASLMGATIGRFANRIAYGKFAIDDKIYQVSTGRGGHALHGGPMGFDRKVWSAREIKDGVEMTLISPDGDMGYPGTLILRVTFILSLHKGGTALSIHYDAETNRPTVVNFTNHAFFNLANDTTTPVLDDLAVIHAEKYTPIDDGGIPTGNLDPVAGTPFDFRTKRSIRGQIPEHGYDNNFVLRMPGLAHPVAEVDDPNSGRTLQVFTTEPGLQFFVPLPPPASSGQADRKPAPVAAFCLETQHFPDAPNHSQFPTTVLRPGETFHSTTIYLFGVATRPLPAAR